jgi:hypothetical protein
MGANAFSRPPTQRDSVRIFTQVNGSTFDSVRRCQTPKAARNFPDTEEVTGSNPVRPTIFRMYVSPGEPTDHRGQGRDLPFFASFEADPDLAERAEEILSAELGR